MLEDDQGSSAADLDLLGFDVRHIQAAEYNKTAFEKTLTDLIRCPERSSSSILRADILDIDLPVLVHTGERWTLYTTIIRRIIAKKQELDQDMIQACRFYRSENPDESLVIFEHDTASIPFYHPRVAALAFVLMEGQFTLAVKPLHDAKDDIRLRRTTLRLAQIVNKHSLGNYAGYQKRVNHDTVVKKEVWQDRYTVLKKRYAKHYIDNWKESTDPLKHVFEDLAIAAFLISLQQGTSFSYVDIACGNGLLVDILSQEGHEGYGFDARRRKSWSLYSGADLRELVLVPKDLEEVPMIETMHDGYFPAVSFLSGNHSVELTPYITLLDALSHFVSGGPGCLIIPCCMYTFNGTKHPGLSTVGGRYASYVKFLEEICAAVGWKVEKEALRIPSTRNIALICRERDQVESTGTIEDRRKRLVQICKETIQKHGGSEGFFGRALSLRSKNVRGH